MGVLDIARTINPRHRYQARELMRRSNVDTKDNEQDAHVITSLLQLVLCRMVALKSPRTSSIVQVIFYFLSFEISKDILRNLKFFIG